MTKLGNKTSRLFQVCLWLFTAVTFADAANLDDFFADTVVIHDDQDAETQPVLVMDSALHVANTAAAHATRRDSNQIPVAPVRVVFDQDSPSLAADPAPLEALLAVTPTEEPATPLTLRISCESLHLRLCTLLL
jgi:hypothetical protein